LKFISKKKIFPLKKKFFFLFGGVSKKIPRFEKKLLEPKKRKEWMYHDDVNGHPFAF
jgi:hypothetical protein